MADTGALLVMVQLEADGRGSEDLKTKCKKALKVKRFDILILLLGRTWPCV